jgi:hypothetical protein
MEMELLSVNVEFSCILEGSVTGNVIGTSKNQRLECIDIYCQENEG